MLVPHCTALRRFRDRELLRTLGNRILPLPFRPSVAVVVVGRLNCSQNSGRSNCSMGLCYFPIRMPRFHKTFGNRFDDHSAHCSRMPVQNLFAGPDVAVEAFRLDCTDNSYREVDSIRRHRCNYPVAIDSHAPLDRCTLYLHHWGLRELLGDSRTID